MKKILPVLFVALMLSACGKRESVKALQEICEQDVKKEGASFDCGCQIDIFEKNLSEPQFDLLHKFIVTERTNKDAAAEIIKQPEFADLFRILVKTAPEIEEQCRKK